MTNHSCVEPGQVVVVRLRAGLDDNAPVGEVQAVDEYGVRITLMSFLTGGFHMYDYFIPWRNIEMMEVWTKDHDLRTADLGHSQRAWTDHDLSDTKSEKLTQRERKNADELSASTQRRVRARRLSDLVDRPETGFGDFDA